MKISLVAFCLSGIFVSFMPADPVTLYSSKEFTITSNSVKQGKYTAEALSPTHIKSDYQSPASQKYTDVLEYKFSINNKDNELAPGLNHKLKLKAIPGQTEEINIVFGSSDDIKPIEADEKKLLPANTRLKIRVDFSPVLKAFKEKGFYETATGEKIYKNDFKRLLIAGSIEPLSWDFENLHSKGLELKDENNDGIYETELLLNQYDPAKVTAKEWKLKNDISQYPQLKSGAVLIDALYNMALDETKENIEADGTFRTGKEWSGVWTRDLSYSVLLGIAAIEPEICKKGLMRKVKGKKIIQDTGTGGAWPVSSDRVIWAVAAYEIYKITGEEAWLKQIYEIIKTSLEDDQKMVYDPQTGLMRGESSFMDWRKQSYPEWMNSVDIYSSLNLGTNAAHLEAYKTLSSIASLLKKEEEAKKYSEIARKLKDAINQNLWLSDKGYYAEYIYGREFMHISPRSEALGEALSVLYDIPNAEQKKSILENTPVLPFGISCFYPQIPGITSYHNNGIWPFVQAFWNLAAAKQNNFVALEQGLAAFYRPAALFLTNKENFVATTGDFRDTEINSDRQLWSVSANLGMIYKVLLGLNFKENSLSFNPVVPKAYGNNITVSNFKYRNAILNVSVKGFGAKIKAFTLDGKKLEHSEIPASIQGKHDIEIQLDNMIPEGGKINLVENRFSPATPRPTLNNNSVSWNKINEALTYVVSINGKDVSEIKENSYEIKESGKTEVTQIKAKGANGFESFYSEPVYSGNFNTQFIEAENFATKSNLPYKGFSGSGFIELTKEKNKEIKMEISVEEEGQYLLDFKYSNGSGPYNTDNKCAIRSLYINDNFQGPVVLPQIGMDEWSNFGYSNIQKVKLNKGKNTIVLRFDPNNENMNGEINTAMLDGFRIRKMNK